MTNGRRARLIISALLILAGCLLMLLSPSIETGLVVFGLGVLLELIGLTLRHRAQR